MKFPKKSAHGSLCCKLITSQVCIFRLKGKEGGNVFHSRFSLLANIPDIQIISVEERYFMLHVPGNTASAQNRPFPNRGFDCRPNFPCVESRVVSSVTLVSSNRIK